MYVLPSVLKEVSLNSGGVGICGGNNNNNNNNPT
jgi:hypothetical protein